MKPLALVLICAGAICAQQESKLTPRELFYSKAPVPASAKPDVKQTPAKKQKGATKSSQPKSAPAQEPEPVPIAEPISGRISPPAIRVRPASATSYVPLGLRYSILKRTGDGQEEVDPGSVFRAGDRIQISAEANDSSYLYIVNRGSSGNWKVLFPSEEIAGGDNRVVPIKRYEIPAGYTFTFDEQPGTERLFIILSRQPEADLENLIYSLRDRQADAPLEGPKKLKPMIAQVDEEMIGRFRTYARDLVIEKVGDSTPGARKEKAVYAVNATGGADARVVAEIALTHR